MHSPLLGRDSIAKEDASFFGEDQQAEDDSFSLITILAGSFLSIRFGKITT
jgi:hypothetical protein